MKLPTVDCFDLKKKGQTESHMCPSNLSCMTSLNDKEIVAVKENLWRDSIHHVDCITLMLKNIQWNPR